MMGKIAPVLLLLKDPNFQRSIVSLLAALGVAVDAAQVESIVIGFFSLFALIHGAKAINERRGKDPE